MKRNDDNPQKDTLQKYLRFTHAGFEFFAAIGVLTWGGWWLDQRYETSPLWILIGLALGFGGGFRLLYKEVYGADTEAGPAARSTSPAAKSKSQAEARAQDVDAGSDSEEASEE